MVQNYSTWKGKLDRKFFKLQTIIIPYPVFLSDYKVYIAVILDYGEHDEIWGC